MQSSKRVLRSNEIIIPSGSDHLDTELDLSFSLQYPHFIKRDGNKLQIMVQRRKKYKNRTILGYKTLAIGQINMSQVLQHSVDRVLSLYSDLKERTNVVAQVTMLALSSQPVDHVENGRHKLPSVGADRSPDIENDSEDEAVEDPDVYVEYSSNDDLSDSPADEETRTRIRKGQRSLPFGRSGRGNLKQKFIALLRRFREAPEEIIDSEQDQDLAEEASQQDIDQLLNELEDMSDSGPEQEDNVSILSTPKPSLRPFFQGRAISHVDILDLPTRVCSVEESTGNSDDSSRRNDSDTYMDNLTDQEQSSDPPQHTTPPQTADPVQDKPKSPPLKPKTKTSFSGREKKRKDNLKPKMERQNSSDRVEMPRKVLLDHLSTVLAPYEYLPDTVILVNSNELHGQLLSQKLEEKQHKIICTCSDADVKATVNTIVTRIQKFCNSNSQAPPMVRIGIIGGDGYISSVLKPYVEQFSAKSPDWQSYIRFLVIPLGNSSIGKYLGGVDSAYQSMFLDPFWRDIFENQESQKPDMTDIVNRVTRYVNGASNLVQLPLAEAMITYKNKSTDEESSQVFLPFINDVRVGLTDASIIQSEYDDVLPQSPSLNTGLSSSPPSNSPSQPVVEKSRDNQNRPVTSIEKSRDNQTPPNSPSISQSSSAPVGPSSSNTSQELRLGPELFMDLQLDYWLAIVTKDVNEKDKVKRETTKCSMKAAFRSLLVTRLGQTGDNTLTMQVVTKEKKQKIMRIGKKSKETESKCQSVDGINRLICTSKSQSNPMTVMIDGNEWTGVKFFQLSSQWQTHIKYFPVSVFGHIDTPM
ncbi:unnamed protein product [Owenia fusiformis]|uniref:Uncharacterized protein n=1 Tax=Owenia fusiformis TaxID=6347 RepID=A0A8J1UKK1_OWEFU|nr:unnamed protein product [Owenia fusiformis]